jgi:hypothetical protein
MQLGIYPVTCDKFLTTRVKAILDTWGAKWNQRGILCFLGDSDIETPEFHQINCLDPGDVFPGRTENRYEDGAHKFFNGIRRLAHLGAPTWLFLCDDDTYVKTDLLIEYCATLDKDKPAVYANDRFSMYGEDRTLHYPSGGAGFLMSSFTLQKIVPHLDKATHSIPDRWGDVMLGMVLREINIPIIDNHVFFELTAEEEWREWQWSAGALPPAPSISYHNMDPDKMREFHNVYYHLKLQHWHFKSECRMLEEQENS